MDIVAITTAGDSLKPRGIVVYDQHGREIWHYTIGPSPQNIVIWEKERGRPDIIMGTFSPFDGNYELHNRTSAMQAYVISIDGYGKTNWVIRLGTHYTGVRVLLADLGGNGKQALYAHKYTAHMHREDEGAVYKISRSGYILNRFEIENSIVSITAARSATEKWGSLYAVDKTGTLFKLDDRLNLLQKKSLNAKSRLREIRLVGVHDYNGDGVNDILLYSFERLLKDKNLLSNIGQENKVFYSDMKFQILSQDFTKLIKSVSVAEEWDKWRGFAVKDLDRPEMPRYPFMALSDKITLFNY